MAWSGSGWEVFTRISSKSPFLVQHFSYLLYTNDLPYDGVTNDLPNTAIYADDTTLYSKCDQASEL